MRTKRGCVHQKSPELIVEIVSKSSALRDEKIKFELYETERVPYYILFYPEDLKAKIYKLHEGTYQKVVDLLEGTFTFDEIECPAKINFDFVFERFR